MEATDKDKEKTLQHVFEYEAKLLGILNDEESVSCDAEKKVKGLNPWNCKNIPVLRRPCEMVEEGPFQVHGPCQSTTSSVVQRKSLSSPQRQLTASNILEALNKNPRKNPPFQPPEIKLRILENEMYKMTMDNSQPNEHDQTDLSGSGQVMNMEWFLRQYFNPEKDAIPDFIMERPAVKSLAVNLSDCDCALQVRKRRFVYGSGSIAQEKYSLQIKTHCNEIKSSVFTFVDNGWYDYDTNWSFIGARTASYLQDYVGDEGNLKKFALSCYCADIQKNKCDLHNKFYRAFIHGVLSQGQKSEETSNLDEDSHHQKPKNEVIKNKKLTIGISTDINGGLWTLKENPEEITCADLAEVVLSQKRDSQHYFLPLATTTKNDNNDKKDNNNKECQARKNPLYFMNIKVRDSWADGYFIGAKHFLNCLTANRNRVDDHLKERNISQAWLMDIDHVSEVASCVSQRTSDISGEEILLKFQPWNSQESQQQLFESLEQIKKTFDEEEKKAGNSNTGDGPVLYFMKYGKVPKVVLDKDGSLLKEHERNRRTIVVKGFTGLKKRNKVKVQDESKRDEIELNILWKIFVRSIGYPQNTKRPDIAKVNGEVELTFGSAGLAAAFLNVFVSYKIKQRSNDSKKKKKLNIPEELRALVLFRKLYFPSESATAASASASASASSSATSNRSQEPQIDTYKLKNRKKKAREQQHKPQRDKPQQQEKQQQTNSTSNESNDSSEESRKEDEEPQLSASGGNVDPALISGPK